MKPRSLIVSLHDVTTSTLKHVQVQVQELAEIGVRKTSLLVIPNYHQKESLEKDSSLCDWLKERQNEGHEIVLHGWSHQIAAISACNPRTWFYENLYTSKEAEFLNMNYEQARDRIDQGLILFKKLQFNSTGFIPPAWLMNSEVLKAAKELGLAYTNTISEIILLPHFSKIGTRSCVWSTRTAWRRPCSLAWNRLLFNQLSKADPMRISLHPHDLDYPSIWRQIKDLVRLALRNREAQTYHEWVEQNEFVST